MSYKKSTWMDGSPVSAEGLADRMDHFCGAGEGGCLVPQSDHELWSQTSHPTSIYLWLWVSSLILVSLFPRGMDVTHSAGWHVSRSYSTTGSPNWAWPDKQLTAWWGPGSRDLAHSSCCFLWYKPSHHGWFLASSVQRAPAHYGKSLKGGLAWAPTQGLSHLYCIRGKMAPDLPQRASSPLGVDFSQGLHRKCSVCLPQASPLEA